MVSVTYIRLPDQLPAAKYNACLAKLPPALQEKNKRFRNERDRWLHLSGQILLMEALQQYGWDANCLHRLQYNEYNRPFVPGHIDFNISHAGDYVVCAVAEYIKLGIDIEKIQPIRFGEVENSMTAEQWNSIRHSENELRTFYLYWTIKESVIKADSRGLSIPLDKICISPDQVQCDGQTWYVKELAIDTGYCTHLCVNREQFSVSLVNKTSYAYS